MSPAVFIPIGFMALVSVLVVVATIVVLVTHLKNLNATMSEVRETLQPELVRLRNASEVARRELEKVGEGADDLRARGD